MTISMKITQTRRLRKKTKRILMRMTLGQRMEKEGFLMLKMMKGMLHSSSDRAGLYSSQEFWGNLFIRKLSLPLTQSFQVCITTYEMCLIETSAFIKFSFEY